MAVNRTPVLKRCRSLGLEPMVLGINKKSNRKTDGKMQKKLSEYGMQLREKQKTKFIYGVLEKQFRNYFVRATKAQGIAGENLLKLLECRLDNVVFRLGFARTRKEARQIVGHKSVLVNGKPVNIPSYRLKAGDTVQIREKSAGSEKYKDIVATTGTRAVPEWLSCDLDNLKGSVVSIPSRDQIDVPVNETLIVEHYSKKL